MKKIYLDQNIWLDIQLNRFDNSLKNVLDKIDRNKVEIIYSPANIEEICNSYCSPNISKKISTEEKDSFLDMLAQISQQTEIVPYANNFNILHSFNIKDGPFIISEHPEECFRRVYQNYDSNEFAESAQKHSIDKSRAVDEQTKGKLGHESFVTILEKNAAAKKLFINLLSTKLIHKAAIDYLIQNNVKLQPWNSHVQRLADKCISDLRLNHSQQFINMANEIIEKRNTIDITTRGFGVCEAAFDALMLTMIEFGYASEKVPMSSLHDNSHSIYGAYCDYFISRDPRLIKKLTSAYEFFGIKTKIINGDKEDWHIYLN
ncbi:hypothetical protein QQF21_21635 [Lelliottia sp. V89_10]|uniref:hypothetical protein n=1 Tax=Lelliottia wanjuensis TaxID=3050585 RepID=UPI00249DBD04|nr:MULTISPECIES: hypothetical protein [unclassified Lelliottia]MDI3360566.1 hypothetical protein [Lelliottia sp. V89_13]MDK9551014.1 hypothetical protein [Lelliottia sp. V89_5]MDK9598227.1 hypothetical protein [Lelliottia sp. V89_10]